VKLKLWMSRHLRISATSLAQMLADSPRANCESQLKYRLANQFVNGWLTIAGPPSTIVAVDQETCRDGVVNRQLSMMWRVVSCLPRIDRATWGGGRDVSRTGRVHFRVHRRLCYRRLLESDLWHGRGASAGSFWRSRRLSRSVRRRRVDKEKTTARDRDVPPFDVTGLVESLERAAALGMKPSRERSSASAAAPAPRSATPPCRRGA
jgi:hypothetical protein